MNHSRLYRTEAIVLRRHDFGEADRILVLLTPGRGKVRAIAKGTRRLTSRTRGHLELFSHSNLQLARGRNLDVVTQAETLRPPRGVRDDLLRATYAYHLVELVDRLAPEGQPQRSLFALLADALAVLDSDADPALLARFFEVRALGLMGFRPQLESCLVCGDELGPEDNVYDPAMGGVVCPGCVLEGQGRLLAPEVFRVLRFLQGRPWTEVQNLRLRPATARAVEEVLVATLRHVLEREMRSVEFLANLRAVTGRRGEPPGPLPRRGPRPRAPAPGSPATPRAPGSA